MSRTPKIKKVFYKCLAENCVIKLEKQYLFCGIECACYSGWIKTHRGIYKYSLIRTIYKIRNYIIHKIILSSRTVYEYFRT